MNLEEVKVYDTVVFDQGQPYEQKLWPKHCVQHSWGAELHPAIKVVARSGAFCLVTITSRSAGERGGHLRLQGHQSGARFLFRLLGQQQSLSDTPADENARKEGD